MQVASVRSVFRAEQMGVGQRRNSKGVQAVKLKKTKSPLSTIIFSKNIYELIKCTGQTLNKKCITLLIT